MSNGASSEPDYAEIARRLKTGMIVPFLGAGASTTCGLPSGRALAARLVRRAAFPDNNGREDLALVASYLVQKDDSITLREELRQAFDVQAQPGSLHRCLSKPALTGLRLFVTTNYDDLLEKALDSRNPWVVVDRGTPGNVWVRPLDGAWQEVEAKNLGYTLTDRRRPIVLKLHGSLAEDRDDDSFLITEEHYVDFLGRPEGGQVPQMLATMMRERSFLFLGYGLRDWNVRVLLRKLAQSRGRTDKIRSWAIVRTPAAAEVELWRSQHVEMHDLDLDEFARRLEPLL
jgi:NAD-dependent SIR2 family protein deacetylase